MGRVASGLTFPNLKGPTHDVGAMREVLTSAKFGIPNDDLHIYVLKNVDQPDARSVAEVAGPPGA